MRERPPRPELGARVKASAYMVRHSTMQQWRANNPDAGIQDAPLHGFRTWKRERKPFVGVFVGVRVMTIKQWRFTDVDTWDDDVHDRDFQKRITPITFWLIAYSTRAKLRYVLPWDVEVLP